MFRNLDVFNFHLRSKGITTPDLGHKTILKILEKIILHLIVNSMTLLLVIKF